MKYKCCKNTKSNKEISNAAGLLGIIAEENRLKILCVLKKGERCVCDIWQDLGIAENLASHHLKVLRKAGLIHSRKEGLKVIYSINKNNIGKFNSLLNKFLSK
ncbi:MAG: metalloregulator ArsR/SmtB family transcription factor [Candidatus Parcubacteria bacterium]|nr:metalloregulator ArsR/SmtB family transcription factor [Candidatus Parcubacteria bacterium]